MNELFLPFYQALEEEGLIQEADEVAKYALKHSLSLETMMQSYGISKRIWLPIFQEVMGYAYGVHIKSVDLPSDIDLTFPLEKINLKEGTVFSTPKFVDVNEYVVETHILEKILLDSLSEKHDHASSQQLYSFGSEIDLTTFAQKSAKAIEKVIAFILQKAVFLNATDIHILPVDEELLIKMRVLGELKTVWRLDASLHSPLMNRLKHLANINIEQRYAPQDGHFSFRIHKEDDHLFDVRIATIGTLSGEKMVLRILPQFLVFKDLETLGFTASEVCQLRTMGDSGLILWTGPANSGKTTSLYTYLNELASNQQRAIYTVEDPVEIKMNGLEQIEVKPSRGLTFENILRGVLRLDPDILMIGELRDELTAKMAVRAAQTGHLVLSTLHCYHSHASIERLRDLGLSNEDIASSLTGVVAQRLVTTKNHKRTIYKEIWHLTEEERGKILANESAYNLRQAYIHEGHSTLTTSYEQLKNAGII